MQASSVRSESVKPACMPIMPQRIAVRAPGGLAHEIHVFPYRRATLALALAVRDLVAEAGAQAKLVRGAAYLREAARDRAVAGVVVKDRGDAAADALEEGRGRAVVDVLQVHGPVEPPPVAFEQGGQALPGAGPRQQASRKGVARVVVEVYEAGHYQPAAGVHILRARVLAAQLLRRAQRGYQPVVANGHRTAVYQRALRVPRHDGAVADHYHRFCSSFWACAVRLRAPKS